jgi:AcrR family transcriptional regulator
MKISKPARALPGRRKTGAAKMEMGLKQPKFKAGAELRERVLEAASRLFAEAGYHNVSMRKIAIEAGCSTMAAYHHFPDKNALFRQLCIDLYDEFATLHHKLSHVADTKDRLKQTMRDFIILASKYPQHYRLAFLTPPVDEQAQELRVKITRPIIAYFQENLRLVLPAGASDAVAEERLHQVLACLYGMAVMLTTHPRVYGLTIEKAIQELNSAFDRIVSL